MFTYQSYRHFLEGEALEDFIPMVLDRVGLEAFD
jgi:hypothetical protein